MTTIFLSYTRADGLDAATNLRTQLTNAGLTVWRDLEEMRGGVAWKEQLRTALRQVDAIVLLLTPGAVASTVVEWEWENALTLEKPVIPLLIAPCNLPAELNRRHYHDFSTPAAQLANLPKLLRDLYQLPNSAQPSSAAADQAAKYVVHNAKDSAIGDNAKTINW